MPRYEFMCETCQQGFEVTLTLAERAAATVRCPGCGSEKVAPQMAVFTPKTARKS